jgi:hypothetical protein
MGYTVLTGEIFRGVRDELVAFFQLDTETFPALGEIQSAVEQRVQLEAPRQDYGVGGLQIAGWRGGWQEDASGRWEADIFEMRDAMWHKVGRALITVRVRGTLGALGPSSEPVERST